MAFRFMQTISFTCLLIILTCTTSLLAHDEECFALFEFKQTISHQPYASFDVGGFQKLESWKQITSNVSDYDFDCCLWDGVVCSNNGHVIELDLSGSYLHGPIKSNSSLFNLIHLQKLNLSMNNFVGSQITSEIAHLKQLRSLDLSSSRFRGQIPIEISHLKHLTLLDLSSNPLKLQSLSFGYLMQNLTRLEVLHLAGVDISSSLPSLFANISSFQSIDLQSCMLLDEFPSNIFNLPNLNFLSIANNPMLTGFLPEFQNNTVLEYLDLNFTSFAGSIPESISKLNQLVFLSLLNSYFSGCIPLSLSNMTNLTFLSLGQDEFMGLHQIGLKFCEKGRMRDQIGKLSNLESLSMIRINTYNEILPSLANLTKLHTLVMIKNLISGHLPSSFMNLTQLRLIDIESNILQGQIPSLFSGFKSLEHLNLRFNNFSDRLDLDMFVGLTKLRTLLLDYNRISFVTINNHTSEALLPKLESLGLSSCNLTQIPSFLRLQNKLSILYLSNNKIEGCMPEGILKDTKETLVILDLSFNSITGFHGHLYFVPWVRLKVLIINYNKLQGWLPIPPLSMVVYDVSNNYLIEEVPPLICEVRTLRVLDLSFNNMTGKLPNCLGNLSNSLVTLDLKRNNFHGPMMNSFRHGSLIQYMDLSENKFTGQVSKSLVNCTHLKILFLGGNSFHDVFPFWLGTHPNLQILILRSNKFHGAIQSFNSPFLKLRILDLSNNGFSGQLPEKLFQTWKAMKSFMVEKQSVLDTKVYVDPILASSVPYSISLSNKGVKREYNSIFTIFKSMDLSCNNLEGHIPQSLCNLRGIESLNISNNHFRGHILPCLGNLTNLESLDLSQNELSDEIPKELLQLGFLEIFNVSFNHLHGAIPQGNQFNTFDNNSYMGNPDLCGDLIYKKCLVSKASILPSTGYEFECLLPNDRIDWIIVSIGVGSGLLIGIVLGNFLHARYKDWLIERFKVRKERWIKRLTNKSTH